MLSGKAVATTKVIGSEVGTSFIEYKIEKKHEITRLRKNGYIKKKSYQYTIPTNY